MEQEEGNDCGVERRKHVQQHVWIEVKMNSEQTWKEQLNKVRWAIITAVAIGSVSSLFALLWWSFTVFIERGGR